MLHLSCCPHVVLACLLLLLCAPSIRGDEQSSSGVLLRADDLVGYYEWTQAAALVTPLTDDAEENPFSGLLPAVEQSLTFPVAFDDYFGLRVFQRELEPSNRFFIFGSIAEGNDFVLSLELLDDSDDETTTTSTKGGTSTGTSRVQLFQEPYWTAYRCQSAANPQNCELAAPQNSAFQPAVEPVVAAVSQITLNEDGTLVLEGPAGRLVGVRQMEDPLFVQLKQASSAFSPRMKMGGLMAMVTSSVLFLA